MGVQGVSEQRGVSQTQSAFREGLLDLIQHIPQQRWLVALGVNGDRLIGGFDQQTDVVTLDRPAVHGGAGVNPLHNGEVMVEADPGQQVVEGHVDPL